MKGVLIYLVLVGIPVAGVIGVLRVGRRIVPPPYVGGTWAVTIIGDTTCQAPPAGDSLTMVVSQSGPHVVVVFENSKLPQLKGRADRPRFKVSNDAEQVEMHALVREKVNRMRAILVGTPCVAARETILHGVRVAAPGAVDGH